MPDEPCYRGPTFAEMLDPRLAEAGKCSQDPGLSDITWKDDRGEVRHLVLPPGLTGVDAQLVLLLGAGFPTGSHKVGAAYAVAMSAQLFSDLKPQRHRLVWPSTGNYGIGGSWVGAQLGYRNAVVLPELMSEERYAFLKRYGAEIIRTPGSEANVKEVYDKCAELAGDPGMRVLNQFSDMANYRFHYAVTGNSILQLMGVMAARGSSSRLRALVAGMGSAGTLAAGDRLKQVHGDCLVVGVEPVECPTLFQNGYGTHAIEGMGDKHVTWIHHVHNMDALVAIEEARCLEGLGLLTSPVGQRVLVDAGVEAHTAEALAQHLGLSGVANILAAIKLARFYRLGKGDIIVTVATDGIDRYRSITRQLHQRWGALRRQQAVTIWERTFGSPSLEWVQEGTRHNRERWHNLKYFTWVEQRGKTVVELEAQRDPGWWLEQQAEVEVFDRTLRQRRGE